MKLKKKDKSVIASFLAGIPEDGYFVHTNGSELFSYQSAFVLANNIDGRIRINRSPSSKLEEKIFKSLESLAEKEFDLKVFGKASALSFEHSHYGYSHGEHRLLLIVREDGEAIAYAYYSVFDDDVAKKIGREAKISDIGVRESERRRGIATKMYFEIKKEHKLKTIPPLNLTEDGSKWRKSFED